jgi:predicted ATP-grasp superfamily ATP-dependent carboligase
MNWLSRQLDKVPIPVWVVIGFCLLPLWNLFAREKQRKELPDDHFV